MDAALLHNLMTGTGSSSQLVGGLVVGMLYAVIGSAPSEVARNEPVSVCGT